MAALRLVISVVYQMVQLITYRSPHHHHQEGGALHQFVSPVPTGSPQQADGEGRQRGGITVAGRPQVRKASARRVPPVGHGKAGQKKPPATASHAVGMRIHKDLAKASHRAAWLPQVDGSPQKEVNLQGGVLVESMTVEEAEQMQRMVERMSHGDTDQEDGVEAEIEDAGEAQHGDQRDRPVTLGGEPKWEHPMSGLPGGVGPPEDTRGESGQPVWPEARLSSTYCVVPLALTAKTVKYEAGEKLYMLDRYHFHLHQKQFETDGRRGGWIGTNGKPRSAILRYPVTMADGTQTHDQTQFWAEDLDSLPYNDSSWRFASCAIVSNSGSLLNAEFGQEIDSHDAVMRINHAPVQGFRRFVGVKTTFDLCNRPHAQRLSKMSILRKNQRTSLVLFESTNWNVYYRLYRQVFRSFPFPGTVVLSPDLLMAAMGLWKQLAIRFPKHAYSCSAIKRAASQGLENKRCQVMKHDCDSTICKPSSGFFALVFASQMCNRISMYGFEAYRFNSKMAKSTKYHYFDDETGTTNVHSFVLLMKVFKYLESLYPNLTLRLSEDGMEDTEGDAMRRMLHSHVNGSAPHIIRAV